MEVCFEAMTPGDSEDEGFFELFRTLRERVFEGTSDFVYRVLLGVRREMEAPPPESLAVVMLVQIVNLLTSWFDAEKPPGPDDRGPTSLARSIPMFESLRARAYAFAPTAALVVAILVGGLVASSILRRAVRALVQRSGIEALAERAGVSRLLYAVGVKQGLAAAAGSLAFAGGALATLAAVSDALGLTVMSTAAAACLRYAPRLLGALAILLGASTLASFVRNMVEHAAGRREDVDSPQGAARAAYALILVVGATLAAEQAGVEMRFLTTLFELGAGLAGLGVALAFALGFSAVFRGMAARHYYRPLVRVGDHVRVGADQGRVVRFSATAVVLATDEGERIVPCLRFLSNTVHVRPPPGAAEGP